MLAAAGLASGASRFVTPPESPASFESQAAAAGDAFEFEKAEDLLRRATAAHKQRYGGSSIEYAAALKKLGSFYRTWSRFSEAKAAYVEALSILEKKLGASHNDLFEPVYFLALDAHARVDLPAAEALYERALTLTKADGRPEAALALHGLAIIADERGDIPKAATLIGRAETFTRIDSEERALVLFTKRRILNKLDRAPGTETPVPSWPQSLRPKREFAGVEKVGAGVTPPSVLQKGEPDYGKEAWVNHYEGTAVLEVVISPDGSIQDLQVLRRLGLGLDEQATAAVRQWRFKPALKDGRPVPVRAVVEVNFRRMKDASGEK